MAAALSLFPAAARPQQSPEVALRAGNYEAAIEGYRRGVRGGGAVEAHRGLVRTYLEVGRYEDAEAAGRTGVERHGAELANALGEALVRRGEREEAEALFRRAMDGAADALDARLNLGVLLWERGDHEGALDLFDTFIDRYNAGSAVSSEELAAVGTAVRYLGVRDPQLFRDALRAYDEALAADPQNHEARVLLAEMLLDKYNETDARAEFERVLAANGSHPRALLGLAKSLRFENAPGVRETVEQALETNPRLVSAHAFIARLELELEDYEAAAEAVERALAVDPVSLEALAVSAAVHYLSGDEAGYQAVRRRALALNPRHAELYNTVSELSVQHRKYREAAALAEQAVAIDPRSWRAHGLLGLNRLRLGRIDEGRASLERSFEGDPYNVWIKNTLDLVDTFERYRIVETPRFQLVLREDEADLLAPYIGRLAEEAYDRLERRYGYGPATPVRLEVYPNHADFSVRTVGLVGMGALGVSFGNVLVMDSPAARRPGEFNWASTLWHELAHAVHLGMTDHNVPRWFTEGLAVYEQRQAREHWGNELTTGFLDAYRSDRLLPVSELNEGFVRPGYPQQVVFSYYQASLVFELVVERHGFDAVLDMLRAYREGATDDEAFRRVLGVGIEEFDDTFDDWFQTRLAGPLAATDADGAAHAPRDVDTALREANTPDGEGSFRAQLVAGGLLVQAGRNDEALPFLLRAHALFPEYTGPDSPHRLLARIYSQRGWREKAAEELAHESRSESALDANLERAELLEALGDRAGAVAALERAIEIYPYEIELHERLADHYAETGDWPGAVRERRAVVTLEPANRAEALYRLALAHQGAGDTRAARRTVLQALEIAPGYPEAQDLLLLLRGR